MNRLHLLIATGTSTLMLLGTASISLARTETIDGQAGVAIASTLPLTNPEINPHAIKPETTQQRDRVENVDRLDHASGTDTTLDLAMDLQGSGLDMHLLADASHDANNSEVDPVAVREGFVSGGDTENQANSESTPSDTRTAEALTPETETTAGAIEQTTAALTAKEQAEEQAEEQTTGVLIAEESTSEDLTTEEATEETTEEITGEATEGQLPAQETEPIVPRPQATPNVSNPTEPPSYLYPSPNPLRYPNQAIEVEIVGTQPISLEEAIQLALRNNLTIQSAMLDVERQAEVVREAQAAWWPQLDLSSDYVWSDSASSRISIRRQEEILGSRSALQTDSTATSFNTELRLSYSVLTSGRRDGRIRSAQERLRLLELEVERQTENVRLSVTEAYYELQQTDQNVIIAQSAVDNSQKSLEDARALERAGVGTQFDVLRSEVQLANDQQQLRQAQSDQQVARRSLAQVLNLSQRVDIQARDPVKIAGVWEISLEETIVLAFRSRAELEQQLAQREISRQDARVARSEMLPQVSVFASANLLNNSDDGISSLTEGYSAGARFSWQLFNGGSTAASIRQQQISQASAELDFSDQRNQIRLQVERAYYQLQASFQNISTAEEALKLAEESLDLARLRFQAGVGTQTEVIDAQNELTRAQGNRVTAILGYNRALANLRRSVSNYPLLDEVDAELTTP